MKRPFLKALLASGLAIVLSACGGGSDAPAVPTSGPAQPLDIVQTAQASPQFSILVEAVVAADLATTLKGTGPFTVFAPTDDAFVALLGELKITKAALLADKALLTKVLTYHVVAGKVLKAGVPVGKPITTLQTETITVDSNFTITDQRARKAKITATDILATNGVIHAIDKVILPTDKNIVQVAQGNPEFSILVEAVVAANLTTTLSGPGPFTVFAPTNTAFGNLLTELNITKAALLADKALLTKVLTYHVVSGRVLKAKVPVGTPITTVQSETFTVDSSLAITDQRARKSNIIITDVFASNGVIHAIDKVILPTDKNIVQVAQGNPEFSILVEAVVAANLTTTLSGTGPFTVFAPTNTAFGNLLTELNITKANLLANTALLTKVLTYHVVSGRVLKAQVPVGTPITTVQTETFTVDSSFVITDKRARKSNIVITDVFATNGVVHAIDKVILPAP
jgi:uncharacterized surface protein with fasciclin (FAS1) repeats